MTRLEDSTQPSLGGDFTTCRKPATAGIEPAAREVFECVAERLAHTEAFRERIHGPLDARDAVLSLRREAFTLRGIDADLPCCYAAGRAAETTSEIAVQLWTLPRDAALTVETVASDGVGGRLATGPGFRMLHLAGVEGQGSGVTAQAEAMFARAERALAASGFSWAQVARTWVRLTRLLDWYGEFNRVRATFLHARGIGRPGRAFPASTGIQGVGGDAECAMDVLAVQGVGARVESILETSRQKQASDYGSSFSRGMELACGRDRLVFVSGTASIDAAGHTRYCWEREAQVVDTLLSIAAMLEDRGGGLRDVEHATLFCKDRATLETYERVVRQLGMTELPVVPVLADVCRPELMMEIDALARVSDGRRR